jgi:hypothetical protein
VRNYLNGLGKEYHGRGFYDSFNSEDRKRIAKNPVINRANPWWPEIEGGKNTEDWIFLLSIDQVVRYFGDSGQLWNWPEDAEGIDDDHNSERIAYDADSLCRWWLRSPGERTCDAAYVGDDGLVYVVGDTVRYGNGGVRPALWLSAPEQD